MTRVLIIHSDSSIRERYNCQLAEHGYEVQAQTEAPASSNDILAWKPEVILLGDQSTNRNTAEICRALRYDADGNLVAIVRIHNGYFNGTFTCLEEYPFDDILGDHADISELLFRVRAATQLQQLRHKVIAIRDLHSEQAHMWDVLLEFSKSVLCINHINALLDRIIESAAELSRCQRVSVMLPDVQRQYLTIARSIGITDEVISEVRVLVGDLVSGKVFVNGLMIDNNQSSMISKYHDRYEGQTFVSLPMTYETSGDSQYVVGVLNMSDRIDDRPFEPWELEFIQLFGIIAGGALDDLFAREARDDAYDSIVIALATLAEYRDNDIGHHVERVTLYTVLLAEQLQIEGPYVRLIDEKFINNIRRAAPLHDIGKVAIPDAILLKPRQLTPEEIEIIRTHTLIGLDTIQAVIKRSPCVDFMEMTKNIVAYHHEWFDGSGRGYPFNLKGEAIPLSARILALADVYDAVTSKRVYKDAMSHEQAKEIIIESSGTQFDPIIVEAFIRLEDEFSRLAAELADDVSGEVTARHQIVVRRDVA